MALNKFRRITNTLKGLGEILFIPTHYSPSHNLLWTSTMNFFCSKTFFSNFTLKLLNWRSNKVNLLGNCDIKKTGHQNEKHGGNGGFRQVWVKCSYFGSFNFQKL